MDIEIVKKLIKDYQPGHSKFITDAMVAERYYRNETDILLPPPPDETEEKEKNPMRNADNRIPFNFHGLLVDQKASYMFTAPPLFDLGTDVANKQLSKFLGDKYPKICKDLCINASNSTVGWLHVWMDRKTGQYKYALVPSMQIIPVWTDDLERELWGILRTYSHISEEGKNLTVYEFWNDTVCQTYAVEIGSNIMTGLFPYAVYSIIDTDGNRNFVSEFEHGMGEVPFFFFMNNNKGTGDLKNIKLLIDVYCKVFSGFVNDLEDIQEIIFILTNYGGANLNEFLTDIKNYKVIKVDNDGGDDKSGVSTLSIEIPVEARKELLATTRKCIFEQGMGIDPDPQNFGNSSGVALGFLYSLLELKAGLQETEFRVSFGRFIRCICRLLNISITDDTIIQTWTRTSVKNDQETAQIAQQSNGIISQKTIVKNHPWVEDPEKEMKQIQKEETEAESKADPYMNVFGNKIQTEGTDQNGGDGVDVNGEEQ